MLTNLINLFWIVLSVIIAIIIVLLVIVFVLLAEYITIKEQQKPAVHKETLAFIGPSRSEMNITTARLLKQDHSNRKYRRPYFQNHVA